MRSKLAHRAVIAVLIFLPLSISCIHVIDSPYPVKEDQKEALMFRKDGLSHLIIRTRISGAAAAKGLAWVIPLRESPVFVKEEPAALFPALYSLAPDRTSSRSGMLGLISCSVQEKLDHHAIEVHEPKTTKHFVTQVIDIKLDDAADALNKWLTKHGFAPVPAENQRHYLKKGRAFLCVRLTQMPEGGSFEMPPVHIAWRSPVLEFPLKFSSHSGVFDADLYVITAKEISNNQFNHWGLLYRNKHNLKSGSQLSAAMKLAPEVSTFTEKDSILYRFKGYGYNSHAKMVTSLDSDPTF